MAQCMIGLGLNSPKEQSQPNQLTRVEHFAVVSISPSMQSIRFVPGRNRIGGDEQRSIQFCKPSGRRLDSSEVFAVWCLKEAPDVRGFTVLTVILDGKQAMTGWPGFLRWVRELRGAGAAPNAVSPG